MLCPAADAAVRCFLPQYGLPAENRICAIFSPQRGALSILFAEFFGDFNFEDSKEYAEYDIKEWIDEIAEQKAWEYIENLKYGDY